MCHGRKYRPGREAAFDRLRRVRHLAAGGDSARSTIFGRAAGAVCSGASAKWPAIAWNMTILLTDIPLYGRSFAGNCWRRRKSESAPVTTARSDTSRKPNASSRRNCGSWGRRKRTCVRRTKAIGEVVVARRLRQETTMSLKWIAERLQMAVGPTSQTCCTQKQATELVSIVRTDTCTYRWQIPGHRMALR